MHFTANHLIYSHSHRKVDLHFAQSLLPAGVSIVGFAVPASSKVTYEVSVMSTSCLFLLGVIAMLEQFVCSKQNASTLQALSRYLSVSLPRSVHICTSRSCFSVLSYCFSFCHVCFFFSHVFSSEGGQAALSPCWLVMHRSNRAWCWRRGSHSSCSQ